MLSFYICLYSPAGVSCSNQMSWLAPSHIQLASLPLSHHSFSSSYISVKSLPSLKFTLGVIPIISHYPFLYISCLVYMFMTLVVCSWLYLRFYHTCHGLTRWQRPTRWAKSRRSGASRLGAATS